jgi:hypothetical protein
MSEPRTKGIYIGAPACFALELAAKHLTKAFVTSQNHNVLSAEKLPCTGNGTTMSVLGFVAIIGIL